MYQHQFATCKHAKCTKLMEDVKRKLGVEYIGTVILIAILFCKSEIVVKIKPMNYSKGPRCEFLTAALGK